MLVSRNSRLNFRKFQNSICLKLSRHTTLLSAGCRARYIEFQGSGWDFQFKIQTLSIMACTQMLFNFSFFSSFTPQNKRQKTWSTQACSMTASQVHINVIFLYKLQLVSVAVSTSHDDKLFYSHDTGVMSHWHDDDRIITDNRPFALRGHVTSFLWKWKLHDFAFEKRLVGHILNKIIVIWFFKPALCS